MKILKLTAENIKKLRVVEITPNGEIVTIAGKNGQGKTSVLDSLWWALAGVAAIQDQPIRKGEKKARIRLDMGELIVERRFTESGNSTLTVENAQGARFPSPQKMLDALLGALSFDPLAFARMEPRKQFDELRKISKLEVDIDQLDGLNRTDYAKRTDINRDAKAKRAQAEAMPVAEGLPEGPLNEDDFLNRIQEAGERNGLIERHQVRRREREREIETVKEQAKRDRDQAAELRARAEALDAQATAKDTRAEELRTELANAEPLPEPVDVAAVRAELDAARLTNGKIVARDRRRAVELEADGLEKQSQALTEQIEARDKAKADAISKASMPIADLGFGAGVVTYRGVPFDQASSAEQLRVSLSIAMATNPKLRVIRIQDGSLLDEDSLAQISAMAKEGDYQVWIERVDTSGKIGVVIEDGQVVAVDGEAVAQAA